MRYQPSNYYQQTLKVINISPNAGRFHKEVLYIGTNFNYTIRTCCNNLSFFLLPCVELLSVITFSSIIWLLGIIHSPLLKIISDFICMSVNVINYSFLFSIIVINILVGSPVSIKIDKLVGSQMYSKSLFLSNRKIWLLSSCQNTGLTFYHKIRLLHIRYQTLRRIIHNVAWFPYVPVLENLVEGLSYCVNVILTNHGWI